MNDTDDVNTQSIVEIGAQPKQHEDEIQTVAQFESNWRIEILQNGKFFQYRCGAGKDRRSLYGGPIYKLTQFNSERVEQYKKRVQKKKARTVVKE